ncbi:MAG: ABC transporter permease [Rubellimicrobium sp.]|nr:ABC transporter permease [Rubellimicrobium sp.]
MTAAALATLLSHWRRNPLQLVTLVAGLALATALWSAVQAINAEARASYDAAAATLGEGQFAQIVATEGGTIPEASFVALRLGGWLVSPVVEGRLNGIRLIGIEPLTAPGGFGPLATVEGAELGDFVTGAAPLFAHPEAAASLALPGVEVIAQADLAPGTAITDIGQAQRLLGLEGQISLMIVAPDQPLQQGALADLAPDLTLRPPVEGADPARLSDSFHLNLTAFGALSFAVGLLIVHSAVGLAFEQRRPTIRTLRALGMPGGRLTVLVAAELALLALAAGAVGLVLGYVIAGALLPDVAATLRGIYGEAVAGSLAFRPAWALSGLAIALVGTALAAAGALWDMARMPLMEVAQSRSVVLAAARSARARAVLGGVLLAMALVVAAFGSGLVAGFALLGGLLVGAALILPLMIDRALAFGQSRATGPLTEWFWADTRAQLPGLSLALAALLLAMAANVGVSTMVSSFRLTFTGFIDQRLASELYVYTDEAGVEPLLVFVGPQVEAVLPLMSVERELAGLPGQIYGARDHATYRDNWTFLDSVPDVWDRLAAGEGVIVNEQLARRAGLSPGDPLTVAPGLALPILGIHGDYGNPIGQAIVTEDLFRSLFPEVAPTRFGLRLPPDQVPALVAALTEDFGLPEVNVVNQSDLKALSLEIFERTFTVTEALNVLTLAVAGLAILMSLLTLAGMRLPQLAPVWALGLTRLRLGQVELLRALLLASLTALCALPLGLVLAWVLLAIVNVEAFGWRLPMFLFPLDYVRLGLLTLIAAGLAALWPALRLARTPPAALLKVFAHER